MNLPISPVPVDGVEIYVLIDNYVDGGLPASDGVKRYTIRFLANLGSGEQKRFDSTAIATHADQALAILGDPSDAEKQLLSPWRYSTNQVLLHADR